MINKILLATIACLVEYKAILFRTLIIPIIAIYALEIGNSSENLAMMSIPITILTLLIYTVIAVITHRVVLLGEGSIPKWGFNRWTKRETKFTIHLLAILLLVMAVGFLLIIPVVGLVIAPVILIYVAGRLSLVFPGIAIDDDISFQKSWGMTRNYQLIMIFVVIIFPLLTGLPEYLLSELPYAFVVLSIYNAIVTVLMVIILSVTYKYIKSEISES